MTLEIKQNSGNKDDDNYEKTDKINDEIKRTKLESNADTEKLINIISSTNNNNTIIPNIDYDKNLITYPALSLLGRDESDVSFLDLLASPEVNVLKKSTYERVLVCPEHPQCFTLNPQLCCKSCASTDTSKLHLFEHEMCGYLGETSEFRAKSIKDISSCPSCKKSISNAAKEIRIVGSWCKCNNCKTKFEECNVKLYCRQFDHAFDICKAEVFSIPYYEIINKTKQDLADKLLVISKIKEILSSNGFSPKTSAIVKGKSGIKHTLDLYGTNSGNQSIVVFVEMTKTEISGEQIDDIIIKNLDISPTCTIFVGIPSISHDAKELTNAYGIRVAIGTDIEKILKTVECHISKLSTLKYKT